MKQITEDYCNLEIAKLLKEKGFDIRCNTYFISDNEIAAIPISRDFNNNGIYLSAPSQSLALKWLREVHNIHIEIRYIPSQFTDEPTYKAMIWNMDTEIGTPLSPNISYTYFETCIDAALKYTLENLI